MSKDNLRNKMKLQLVRLFLIWVLLGTVAYVRSKPIVATTTGSPSTRESIEISGQPKIVDIALPLSLSTTEDLITWATYAIRLMASKINVTVNHMKNDSKALLLGKMYNTEVLPRMESLMEKLTKHMPKMPPSPTKSTVYRKDEKINGGESTPRGFNAPQTTSTTNKPSGNSRSFDIYPKVTDPRYPYNPFAGIFIETVPNFNPFIRYGSNVVTAHYQQSGSKVYPEHTIFPGVGYLPLSNKKNLFQNSAVRNTSDVQEPHKETTTVVSTTTMDLSMPEKIQNFNNEFHQETTTLRPLITVPFEAYITITREGAVPPSPLTVPTTPPAIPQASASMQTISDSYSTINNQKENDYYSTTIRDPPDDFPPYFNGNNGKLKEKQNTKVEVVFEEEEITTPRSEKKKEKVKKQKEKVKKKKKQPNSLIEQMLTRLIAPKSRNQTNVSKIKDDRAPIIRIVSERNQKLKKQQNKKKKIRLQNITLETDVDDYDDEKLGENDSDSNEDDDDRRNETGANSNQEEDDDDGDEEEEQPGSIQGLLDILPLAAPILEDLSDPNTMTDFVGLIQAALPLIQGIIEGDEDTPGIDIGGTIGPVLAGISAGPNGEGSDVAAALGPILSLLAPLIGPLIGPLVGPLLRLSSNPPDKGFSLGALVNSIAGPLSQPTEPGGMSPFSNLLTQVVAGLSREITSGNSGSDFGALVGSVLMGVIAGTSAGLSGGSSGGKVGPPAPPAYGPPQGYGPVGSSTNYGSNTVPANTVNPIQLIGTSLKDILNAGVTVVSSLITAVTGLLGASSASEPQPSYGQPSYGAPPPQNYNRPRKFTAT